MITTPPALLRELQARGLADAALAEPAAGAAAPARPWYVGALLGASGWVAGLFMLGFVAILFQPDSAPAAALGGAALLAAAWGLYRADRDGAFVAQLALALSIAGQCLVVYAMTRHANTIAPVARAALVLQVALALAMPNALHRSLSALFATIAWALTVRFALFGEAGFGHGTRETAPGLPAALAGWLLAWAPVAALLAVLIRREPAWMARGWQPVLRPIMAGLVVGLAFATLVSYPFESFRWFGGEPASKGGLALWPLLSALAALGGVAAGFALRSPALMGACALAALLHVSHGYYVLGTSLLVKSMLMLATGAVMLLAARSLAMEPRP